MTTERLLEIFEDFRTGHPQRISTDELVDAGALAYDRDDHVLSFMIGLELGARHWRPTAEEAARLHIRERA